MNFTPIAELAPVIPETFNAPLRQLDSTLDTRTLPKTSISEAPSRLGALAIVGGVGYLATGTASPSDWKQITN